MTISSGQSPDSPARRARSAARRLVRRARQLSRHLGAALEQLLQANAADALRRALGEWDEDADRTRRPPLRPPGARPQCDTYGARRKVSRPTAVAFHASPGSVTVVNSQPATIRSSPGKYWPLQLVTDAALPCSSRQTTAPPTR